MGYIEAGTAVVYGKIVEGLRVPFKRDLYVETLIIPGFSDAHAHPQVVDAGIDNRVWRNSYEWIENRTLRVDEASIRSDLELSTRLARLLYKRMLLSGVTLVAVTGRLEANVEAWLSLNVRPRAVFLPTAMKRRGWKSVDELIYSIDALKRSLRDVLARLGIFVHSLRLAGAEELAKAALYAVETGGLVGVHLDEGVNETEQLRPYLGELLGRARIVAVHCIDTQDPSKYGLLCAACPASNLVLYRRTRKTLRGITSFGSDWPHLLGTVTDHLPLLNRLYPGFREEILRRATIGGYRDYGMMHAGDMVGYEVSLDKLLERRVEPLFVSVSWRIAVWEGILLETSETLHDVEKETRELIREAIELYPSNEALGGDPLEEARRALDSIMVELEKYRVAETAG